MRWPEHVPAGGTRDAIQGLIDLPATFLSAAGAAVPSTMQGLDQLDVWRGGQQRVRDHVICEHRHQPTAFHLRCLITERHKLTVYRDQPYGELFDLVEDPGELSNRWDDPACKDVKADLMHQFVNAHMRAEPMPMPRIASA